MRRNIFCLACLWIVQACLSLDRADILYNIRQTSRPDVIPTQRDRPVAVSVSLKFINILEVNEITNEVDVVFWQQTTWSDRTLAWNSSHSPDQVSVPISSLWVPDLAAYNAISKPEVLTPQLAHVVSDGEVQYTPSIRQRFSCDVSGVDTQSGATCRIKIGSWTHHSREISVDPTTENSDDSEYFSQYSRFEILDVTQKKNSVTYSCCPEAYEDVEVSLNFRKKGRSEIL
uniref:ACETYLCHOLINE BINDING PROTEIN n=1 Tax=Lymnaea stagnalis TaxID=6523 RepID=UPI00066EFF9C|nr:Chain S, ACETYLCHOLINE BINDING PROTEIN [Lymnaea stagnalis]